MKKKLSITILLMSAVMLTACGTKETVDTDVDNKTVNEVVVNKPTTVPEVSTPTSVPAPAVPAVTDKVDSIVGIDISVAGATSEINVNTFPELRMYVTGDMVEKVEEGFTRYQIPNDTTTTLQVIAGFTEDMQCFGSYMVPHYETAEYGRYIIDIDYQENISFGYTNINVYDTQSNTGIHIELNIGIINEASPTDEQRSYIKQYALMNAEYIKEQVSQWPQDFASSESVVAPVKTPAEAGVKVYSLDAYADITVTLTYSDDGTVELLCQSPSDATIQQKLVTTAGGKLQALRENGEMFMEITVSDGKIFLDTPFMEYANFFGDYTLKE